jgi:hypothetical protein
MRARILACSSILVAVLLAAGCGGSSDTKTVTETKTVTQTTTVTTPTATDDAGASDGDTEPAAQPTAAETWFVRGEQLAVTDRPVQGEQVATRAMEQLLRGPSAAERRAGTTSAIPAGTTLRSLDIDDGLATVDLSKRFESGGGSLSMTLRVAQVVYTLTQFGTIDRVAFRLDGKPVQSIGGEGVVVDPPVGRDDYDSVAPAIVVESPDFHARVHSPITVSGTANVFEAVLEAELRSSTNRLLDHVKITASAGTGTRGSFRGTLKTDVTGRANVVVFSRSAKDGTRINLVAIPVVIG